MKRKMLTIGFMVFLLPFALVCGGEKTEGMSVAEKAFQLRLDGKSHQAKEVLAEYLKEHPDDAFAQFEYSRVLFYLFDFEVAEKHAAKAVELDKENPRYHFWLGNCLCILFIDQAHHKGNLDESILKRAIPELQKAVALKPDYHEARFELIGLLNDNPPEHGGDPNQAKLQANCLMEMDLSYGLKAKMVVDGERPMEWKIDQYRLALDKEPNNASLHSAIALLYAESGQTEKMQQYLDKALELDRQQMNVLLNITFQLAAKQDFQSAKEMVNRYLELAKDEPAAMQAFGLHFLAVIERKSGNQAEFEKVAEQMKQTDPDGWRTMQPPQEMLFEPLIAAN